ncbi:IclR family transcriptional regulator [Aureimonas psammosilenae]|uniref:IclR family transcriptional regulator n=1 Tax=Aureimonas psammosilenae TaxID=2495496 RepID=UPI0012610F00|nr:IclR family transcriptional regulator [Aureimonas psammosilenae]
MSGTLKLLPEPEERYRAPALDKGLDIIELLSEQPGGLTRAEIVKAMGRSPSEVYRMLERLVARDYVGRSLEGDRYALTMKLFALAHRHPPLRRLVTPAQPLMDDFSRQARQSCHLVAPEGGDAIVVAHASCPGNWEFGIRIGAPIDLLQTGSGETLLAFTAPEALSELLSRWEGSERLPMFRSIETRLAGHRAKGYRTGKSRQVQGIEDISVPILSPDGHALAVLTCPFVHRLDAPGPKIADALSLLKDVAARLSLS